MEDELIGYGGEVVKNKDGEEKYLGEGVKWGWAGRPHGMMLATVEGINGQRTILNLFCNVRGIVRPIV